jgi:phosphoadenosine phosphosulfate reductase
MKTNGLCISSAFSYPNYTKVESEIRQFLNSTKKTLYWCKNCEAPLLTPKCFRCDYYGKRFIADAKPVFVKEKQMLEAACGKKLPENLFKSKGRIYHKGKMLLYISVQNGELIIKKDNIENMHGCLSINPNASMQYMEKAIEANLPILYFLEKEATQAINEIVSKYPNLKLVVMFSGGKDSVVVAHLVSQAVINSRIVSLFFADTTLEHPETNGYVKELAQNFGLPVTIEKANSDFVNMCNQLEPPSRIMRWCCTIFKANPLNSFLNRNGGILSFDGIRRSESNRRRIYERLSGNKKALRQLVFRPILEWSSLAVWLYIFAYKIPYNPVYEKGYARVGCIVCPFSSDFDDLLTRKFYPEITRKWEEILTTYFQTEYTDKFDPYQAEEWFKHGLWKMRKPHHNNKTFALRSSTCASLKEYAYELNSPITNQFLEYLKPLGILTLDSKRGYFKIHNEERLCISGSLGDNQILVSFIVSNARANIYLLERQIKKAINCIKCGACIYTCLVNAIQVKEKECFMIDETKCVNCLMCVKSNFTHYGCVALSYKRERNWLVEV